MSGAYEERIMIVSLHSTVISVLGKVDREQYLEQASREAVTDAKTTPQSRAQELTHSLPRIPLRTPAAAAFFFPFDACARHVASPLEIVGLPHPCCTLYKTTLPIHYFSIFLTPPILYIDFELRGK